MANYSVLKAAVQAVVKTNGNQEITGANMQSTLISIINSLGTGYQFMGVATPSTSPGTPDYNVAYIGGAGTYANFGSSITIPVGSICVFKYNGSWTKEQIKMFDGIDDVPTANSNNLVKSGGVYDVENGMQQQIDTIKTEAKMENIGTHFGLIGAADGVVYDGGGGGNSIYTDAVQAEAGMKFEFEYSGSVSLNWHRAFFYNNSTFVEYKELGSTLLSNYTLPTLTNAYNNVRFNFSGTSAYSSPNDISVDYWLTLKQDLEDLDLRVSNLEAADLSTEIETINKGYRNATNNDFTQSFAGAFTIENGKLYGTRAGANPQIAMIFNEDVKAIEFDISSLWDSNFVSLAFGIGKDTGSSDKDCYALCYLPTSSRPNEIGYVQNQDFDGSASNAQSSSIYGQGHFSGDYRQPQIIPATVSVGDLCRIELIDGHFFLGTKYNNTTNSWDWWFCLDADGAWNNPQRYGWSVRKAIGFAVKFASFTKKEMLSNLHIIDQKNTALGIFSTLGRNLTQRRQWVAIGDSITEINKNNGLSYVGYAERALNYLVNNQGQGGWTIYKLWRDRETAGWETAVQALKDGDIVTILAGTNDFDTANFFIPANDEAMDAAGNPHPRFGTTDASSQDAKDTHTTLGCLRLIIEDILTLNPKIRLIIFSPFYREKGQIVSTTGWNKMYINSDGKTIYDYADAIYSVAREYNLPAYNTCRDCGINSLSLETYTYDDLHIGQAGGQLIGDYVAKRIIEITK